MPFFTQGPPWSSDSHRYHLHSLFCRLWRCFFPSTSQLATEERTLACCSRCPGGAEGPWKGTAEDRAPASTPAPRRPSRVMSPPRASVSRPRSLFMRLCTWSWDQRCCLAKAWICSDLQQASFSSCAMG